MGFIEYARSQSFEKNILKQRIIIDKNLKYPKLKFDPEGSTLFVPLPNINGEQISFLGYTYTNNDQGKIKVAQLFKSTVIHLSAHTVTSSIHDFRRWKKDKNILLSKFISSLVEDLMVNTYITTRYPDRFRDLSYANALALFRMRDLETINVPSTRLMASLLIYGNVGLNLKSALDADLLSKLFQNIDDYKILLEAAIIDEDMSFSEEKIVLADAIYSMLIKNGPIVEVPSLPFTENHGVHTLFPEIQVPQSLNVDKLTRTCLNSLGSSNEEVFYQSLSKLSESEALQVFESQIIDNLKEESIIQKYEEYIILSRFKEVEFPLRDQTEFLRLKRRCKKETNTLIEVLNSVIDSEMEDNRKMYGVLDLSDVIQVIAGKGDRTDVFLRNEIMEKSYAWAIVIDSSKSMHHVRDYTLENTIALTEAASKVLLDQNSWGIFAFNEKLQVIKDFKESYNTRVRSRIGGLVFEGATYLPDVVDVVGRILRKREEDIKIMFVISDGQPLGYANIFLASSEVVNQMKRGEIVIIGIGVQSNYVEYIFENNVISYNLKDCVRDIGKLYLEKSHE